MPCQTCGFEHLVDVVAKCSDLCSIGYKGNTFCDYVPSDINITHPQYGNDYVAISYCPKCGQMQGDFTTTTLEVEKLFTPEEE